MKHHQSSISRAAFPRPQLGECDSTVFILIGLVLLNSIKDMNISVCLFMLWGHGGYLPSSEQIQSLH